jgi:hypothetical protein
MSSSGIVGRPWKKGQSGNVLGRPKGCLGLARYVSSVTGGGKALVDFLVLVAEGKVPELKRERMRAIELLLDRGFGRPVQADLLKMQLDTDKPLRIEIVRSADWRSS